ncbi:MAG: DUF721 domain-containing protein [Devosiaceae bacterium]|nr:DUF721 domain-containing protein [Devosiaceae bacterium MH13]
MAPKHEQTRPHPRPRAAEARGQLLGHSVTTRAAQPTSAQPISALVSGLVGQRGGKAPPVPEGLMTGWPDIVGERLAGRCMPLRLRSLPKSRSRTRAAARAGAMPNDGALLEVRADADVAIDLTYAQDLICERVNAALGYSAIAAIKVLPREPMHAADTAPMRAQKRVFKTPGEAEAAQADQHTGSVDNGDLRAALRNLGRHVFANR